MRAKLFIFTLCFFACLSMFSKNINESQAIQLVKQTRNVSGAESVNYYIATVDSLIDEYYCNVTPEIKNNGLFADNSQDKWLVFVDEEPLEAWSHDCTYYYIPKNYNGDGEVPVVAVTGGLPPYGYHLNEIERNVARPQKSSIVKRVKTVSDHKVPVINGFAGDTRVVFVCVPTGYYVQDHYQTVVSAYDVLHNTYGIPKSNFCFLISDGNDDPLAEPEYQFSHDIDGDGVDEEVQDPTYSNLFNTLAGLRGKAEHLFVCFIGQSFQPSTTRTFLVLQNGRYLEASDFEIMLSAANASYSNVLLAARASSEFAGEITGVNLQNTVFTSSTTDGHNVQISLDQHIVFANTWFNSLSEASSSADADGNGIVTMQEAYDYTNDYMIDDYPLTFPTIKSNPSDVASKLAFNSIPAVDMSQSGVDQGVEIESVSPNPSVSTVNVKLSAKAASGSSLVVTSISDSRTVKTVQVPEGEEAASVSLDDASAGNYAVSLQVNGKVVSSKQVVKY